MTEEQAAKAQNIALLEALMDMVHQHCTGLNGFIDDGALSANENAVAILEEAGLVKDNRLLWDELEARKRQKAPSAEALGAGGW